MQRVGSSAAQHCQEGHWARLGVQQGASRRVHIAEWVVSYPTNDTWLDLLFVTSLLVQVVLLLSPFHGGGKGLYGAEWDGILALA